VARVYTGGGAGRRSATSPRLLLTTRSTARAGHSSPLSIEQADRFAGTIAGTGPTLRAILDIEEGSGNDDVVAREGASVVSVVGRAFVERITARTRLAPILYAGGWLRSLGLRDRMGCEALWLAAYVARLPAREWSTQLGFAPDDLWAWQYAGLGGSGMLSELSGYPRTSPIGDADLSAVVMPDGLARMRWLELPRSG